MIGRPSTKDYLEIVDNNQLQNCPVERNNVVAAEVILGHEVGSLQVKTVRSSPNRCHSPTWAETTAGYSATTASRWVTIPKTAPVTGSREHTGLLEASTTTTK